MKYICGYFLIGFVFVTVINGGHSATTSFDNSKEKKPCVIKRTDGVELSYDDWNYGITLSKIEDTAKPGTELLTLLHENVAKVTVQYKEKNEIQYVEAKMTKEKLTVLLTSKFSNYEEEQTDTEIEVELIFECMNEKKKDLSLAIPIHDNNNHPPQFVNAPYKYTIPMPILKGFEFDILTPVIARDVDLTNDRITYKIEDEKLSGFVLISTVTDPRDKKNYLSKFITTAIQDFYEDITFTISATDSGTPSLNSTTTVNIHVDKSNSYPRFAQPYYIADLTNFDYRKNDKTVLSFLNKSKIILEYGYTGLKDIALKGLSKENEKHFKLTKKELVSGIGVECSIEINSLTIDFMRQKALSLIVTASVDKVETYTIVTILLPEIPKDTNALKIKKAECESNPEESKESSTNGYMVATIILAIISITLLGGLIYLFLKR